MAKVKDLIKDSVFITAPGFEKLSPDVTVVIPTFRRGDNGLFEKSVQSILKQSFSNFELIIVDDASTDSTFSKIEHFMCIDNRVSVIRHKKNIGLPAVSEIEAFFKSRSNRFFYAFDDNEFHEKALEKMMSYLDNNKDIKIAYMQADLLDYSIIGNQPFFLQNLRKWNHIPNPGVIVEKSVLENVGLYDPHVALIGGCDWDLWIRISQKYVIGNISKILCTEKGITQKDSLGNVYKIDLSLIFEYINTDRNENLLPKNILEYEIDVIRTQLTHYSQKAIVDLLKNKFCSRFWYKAKKALIKDEPYIVFLCDNYYEYSHIKCECGCNIVFIEFEKICFDVWKFILNSNVLIIEENKNIKCKQMELKKLQKLYKHIGKICFFFENIRDFSREINKIEINKIEITDNFAYACVLYTNYSFMTVLRRFLKSLIFPKKYAMYNIRNSAEYLKILFLIYGRFCGDWLGCFFKKILR